MALGNHPTVNQEIARERLTAVARFVGRQVANINLLGQERAVDQINAVRNNVNVARTLTHNEHVLNILAVLERGERLTAEHFAPFG